MSIKPPLVSISLIAVVLMALSIIPSCAFASEGNLPNRMCEMRFGPGGNVTEENFTEVQTSILDSISKQITELQSFYTNVSEASNASDLQEVLSSHRQANECMGPGRMNMGHGKMNMGHGKMNMGHGKMNIGPLGMNGFKLSLVENVTDENFTAVQTEILGSLQSITDMLKDQQNHTEAAQDNNRTEELNKRITEIQNLSIEVSDASTAAELQEVVFTYMQTQAVDSIEKKIEHLQAKVSENESTSGKTTELSSRITELTTLKEKISGAESIEDLKTIVSSYNGTLGMRKDLMRHGGHGSWGCHMDRQGRMSSTDNSTDSSTG
ncbi:MAG: hypothetical protein EHM20_04885 [Alphaproteobacteria bacterium]|nr:MAG: hypothetical protein EHM20_04885 [Alphaproteobacteria bacterium]